MSLQWPWALFGLLALPLVVIAYRRLIRAQVARRADLARQGLLAVNGPFDEQSDPSYRGMSIFACDPAEASRLSDGDPSVAAGRLTYDVMEWWVRAGSLAFPRAERPVGDRRSMPDD